MWVYQQSTGVLSHDLSYVAEGYSGHGEGKNRPEFQEIADVGPIPVGSWTITGPPQDTPSHGPCVLRLTPSAETDTYGRSGFLLHGDSVVDPGAASMGCIVLPRPVREAIWESGDRDLTVTP